MVTCPGHRQTVVVTVNYRLSVFGVVGRRGSRKCF